MGNSAENQPRLISRRTFLRQAFETGAGIAVLGTGILARRAEAGTLGDPTTDPDIQDLTYSQFTLLLSDPSGVDTLSKKLRVTLENDVKLSIESQTITFPDSGLIVRKYMLIRQTDKNFIRLYVPDNGNDLSKTIPSKKAILLDKFTAPDGVNLGDATYPFIYEETVDAPPASPTPTPKPIPTSSPLPSDCPMYPPEYQNIPCPAGTANLASIATN